MCMRVYICMDAWMFMRMCGCGYGLHASAYLAAVGCPGDGGWQRHAPSACFAGWYDMVLHSLMYFCRAFALHRGSLRSRDMRGPLKETTAYVPDTSRTKARLFPTHACIY